MGFENKTDEELIAQAQGLNQLIFEEECYGTKDLISYELILRELERRGYKVKEELTLRIERKGGEGNGTGRREMKKEKKELVRRWLAEGRIRVLNEELSCYAVPSEAFLKGITPSLVQEVIEEMKKKGG